MGVIDQEKGDSLLFLKLPHKFHLMFMNILKGKSVFRAFFRIEAGRRNRLKSSAFWMKGKGEAWQLGTPED